MQPNRQTHRLLYEPGDPQRLFPNFLWGAPWILEMSITSNGGPEILGEARPMEAAAADEAFHKSSYLLKYIHLFIYRANRLQILFLPGVNIGWSASHQERLHSDIPNFALPSFPSSNQGLFIWLSTQVSNSPNNPEGIATLRAKLARCWRGQNLVTLQQGQWYLQIFIVLCFFRFVQDKRTCAKFTAIHCLPQWGSWGKLGSLELWKHWWISGDKIK